MVSAHGPGYPLFLAAVFALGGSLWSAIILQSVAGACTAVFIAVLATRWFGREAGLGAGLLYATFAPAVLRRDQLACGRSADLSHRGGVAIALH